MKSDAIFTVISGYKICLNHVPMKILKKSKQKRSIAVILRTASGEKN